MKAFKWPARAAAALAVVGLACVPLVIALQSTVTPVRFHEPETAVGPGMVLPREVSRTWLLQQVRQALEEQLGNVKVVGMVGAVFDTTLYSRGKPKDKWLQPEQVFHIALRCVDGLCVFAISREQSGAHFEQQGVLLADMSIRQWRDIVRSTTLALYP
jgi:hypothetical protein